MLKIVKIQKNTIVYKSIPYLLHALKWLNSAILWLVVFAIASLESFKALYIRKISNKINNTYKQKEIVGIKRKYPKSKKGK